MNKSPQDLGIPVLTEVISAPPQRSISSTAGTVEETREEIMVAAEPSSESFQSEPVPINGWIAEEWTRLEQKISERVLAQVLDRVDGALDQQITASLESVLQTTVHRLADDIKQGLHQTLHEVISDAVTLEIERMRFTEK